MTEEDIKKEKERKCKECNVYIWEKDRWIFNEHKEDCPNDPYYFAEE